VPHIGSVHGDLEVAEARAVIAAAFDDRAGTIYLFSPLETPLLRAQH
jgi:hypothetical protein